MDALRRFGAIVLADLLQRSRTPRFWLVVAVTAAASWLFFPPFEADYLTVSLAGESRGRYSSAWVGMSLALEFGSLLSLIGFYLVRGTLTRDLETRVWQLLVATPMTRSGYLLAKWASHLLVFALIVAVGLLVGLAAQLVRAEVPAIDLLELAKPSLFVAMPALALTAAIAIWFDLVPWLRRTAGNVAYFFLWAAITSVALSQLDPGDVPEARTSWMSDPNGIALVTRDLDAVVPRGQDKRYSLSVGRQALQGDDPVLFDWNAWSPRPQDLAGRALWLGLGVGLVLLAAPLLDRFAARTTYAGARRRGAGRRLRWLDRLLRPLQRGRVGALAAAELRVALRRRRPWWWLALLAAMAVQLLAPPKGMALGVMAGWLLSLDVFARLMLREREHATAGLVFTAVGAARRLLGARVLATLLLAWTATLPAMLRLSGGDGQALAVLLAGASMALAGLAAACIFRNPRPFELLVVTLAYGGTQGLPALNVVIDPASTLAWHAVAVPAAAVLLLLAWPRMARAA